MNSIPLKIMLNIDEIVIKTIKDEVKTATADVKQQLHDDVTKAVVKDLKMLKPLQVVLNKVELAADPSLKHELTPIVLNYIAARVPVLLVGQAGSGKTHIAVNCAQILGLPHYSISVNEQTSKSDFLGYTDATGKAVVTNFRKAYETGGVFIIDEIDAGNPNILTVINSALSNDFCPFPDAMVPRHKDFVAVCTANTYGEGESLQYIGRNILDSATRDRFATVAIGYSDLLEKTLLPNYFSFVRELRAHFERNGVQIVVSTRGGIRLETLRQLKEADITFDDIVACLNLHTEVKKDSRLVDIIKKYGGVKK